MTRMWIEKKERTWPNSCGRKSLNNVAHEDNKNNFVTWLKRSLRWLTRRESSGPGPGQGQPPANPLKLSVGFGQPLAQPSPAQWASTRKNLILIRPWPLDWNSKIWCLSKSLKLKAVDQGLKRSNGIDILLNHKTFQSLPPSWLSWPQVWARWIHHPIAPGQLLI